jgi:hypothetical protein
MAEWWNGETIGPLLRARVRLVEAIEVMNEMFKRAVVTSHPTCPEPLAAVRLMGRWKEDILTIDNAVHRSTLQNDPDALLRQVIEAKTAKQRREAVVRLKEIQRLRVAKEDGDAVQRCGEAPTGSAGASGDGKGEAGTTGGQ